jgi:hypothetical protein
MKTEISPERQALRWQNRNLSTVQVLEKLKAEQPAVHQIAEVVGTWVWVTFPSKPDQEVREWMSDAGFRYNAKRNAWQHCCGRYSRHAPYDPRAKYGAVAAEELAA